jgi:hypothetical protein
MILKSQANCSYSGYPAGYAFPAGQPTCRSLVCAFSVSKRGIAESILVAPVGRCCQVDQLQPDPPGIVRAVLDEIMSATRGGLV